MLIIVPTFQYVVIVKLSLAFRLRLFLASILLPFGDRFLFPLLFLFLAKITPCLGAIFIYSLREDQTLQLSAMFLFYDFQELVSFAAKKEEV